MLKGVRACRGPWGLARVSHRRAFEGVEEPVFHQGKQCGTIRRYSDTLTIFLLKAHRPAKYRERREHIGEVRYGVVSAEPMTEDEWAERFGAAGPRAHGTEDVIPWPPHSQTLGPAR